MQSCIQQAATETFSNVQSYWIPEVNHFLTTAHKKVSELNQFKQADLEITKHLYHVIYNYNITLQLEINDSRKRKILTATIDPMRCVLH